MLDPKTVEHQSLAERLTPWMHPRHTGKQLNTVQAQKSAAAMHQRICFASMSRLAGAMATMLITAPSSCGL